MTERTFDRRIEFDPTSRNFGIRALIGAPARVSRSWYCHTWLDQGSEGACVGFAWSHELAARPLEVAVTDTTALDLYHQAQLLDVYEDTPPAGGTSVLAGAKVVADEGHMPEYRWAFGLDDVLDTLSAHGPVVLGTNWYEGMFDPDEDGFVYPTGAVAGGHAILIRGVAWKRGHVRLRNSWGRDWGLEGDCRIRFEDLNRLLHEDGEACVPVVRA